MIKSINNENYQSLIDWLKTERQKQSLTVRQLALRIDEPFQFVSKIETAQRKLNVYEYVQYCAALNLDPSEGLAILSNKKVINL
jgi:transcriptional regulator with XRE-family HTH domain